MVHYYRHAYILSNQSLVSLLKFLKSGADADDEKKSPTNTGEIMNKSRAKGALSDSASSLNFSDRSGGARSNSLNLGGTRNSKKGATVRKAGAGMRSTFAATPSYANLM